MADTVSAGAWHLTSINWAFLRVAALILRTFPEVVTAHYIKFEKEGKKVEAAALLTQAFDEGRVPVQ
jgi:hypothetical protein